MNYKKSYYVAIVSNFYGPSNTVDFAEDGREFETVEEARKWIDEESEERYELAHNEASSPEYYVIDESTYEWLHNSDAGKYDWDDCVCDSPLEDGQNCTQCESCYNNMHEQDVAYIVDHAI